ncbi:MAG: hypothetical protein ACE145_18295 [Terriglobia bacterium]
MKAENNNQSAFCFSSFILHTSTFLAVVCALAFPAAIRAEEYRQISHFKSTLFWRGTLYVDTRIGDVKIEGWDKSDVEIEAEKVVQAGSPKGAQKSFEQIKIQMSENGEELMLRAIFPPRRPWRLFRGATKLSVNFLVRMPRQARLALKCVDGDIRVRGISGNQTIRVSYGDVEVTVPSLGRLHSLDARSFLGYVQSDLHGEDSAGWGRQVSYFNHAGEQDIHVRVRLGGVYVYGYER